MSVLINGMEMPKETYAHCMLTHGESHRIGEPICVEYSIMHGERFCPVPIMINEMMDKMRHGLLDLVKQEGE